MSKVRIYELARKLGKSNKAIIDALKDLGVEAKSHMSTVEEKDINTLTELMSKGEDTKEADSKTTSKVIEKEQAKKKKLKSKKEKQENAEQKKKKGRKARKAEKERKKEEEHALKNDDQTVTLEGRPTARELADKLGATPAELLGRLLKLGLMITINQQLDKDIVDLIADEYDIEIKLNLDPQEEEIYLHEEEDEDEEARVHRPPVATVLGHVDHGKTSLLDSIRQANVTASEAGGITQHIGAYRVKVGDKQVVFLDTPGHEAFTAMRARGAQATDIAILVVAADDGVMPQTVEAINHVKAAGVPIIVAVNKIDKPNANPDRVKQQLSEYGLIPEEWGGETIFVNVSAINKEGIDTLLEMVLLLAEMAEFKANPNKKAKGTVIEAKLDKNRGSVATVLIQDGTLRIGEPIICGTIYGKVRAMVDDKGKRTNKAGPSTPVEILGLHETPEAGEVFQAVKDEKVAKNIAEKRAQKKRDIELNKTQKVTLEEFFDQMQETELKDLKIIIKSDVHGSAEALKESLLNIDTDEVRLQVIHNGVGAITESDVMLASASNAIIIGFNVRPTINARKLAENEGLDLRLYRIIYEVIDDIRKAIAGMLTPVFREVILGQLEVRQTFKVSKIGTVAGCHVQDGKINRNSKVRIIRDGVVIHEGELSSLKRFKDDVKEVATGYECGIMIDKFNDIQEADIVECYAMEEVKPETI